MMNDKSLLPNFLIVGAPRCGTTSLYHYLNSHPEICMSSIKEPHFISAQFMSFPHNGPGDQEWDDRVVKDMQEYRALFSSANGCKCLGEASADLLYHYAQSIPVIHQLLGDVKIVIILRNPIERAFSNYLFMRQNGLEELSFPAALNQEENRRSANFCYTWFYQDIGFYYKQVVAFQEAFSSVLVLFYKDIKASLPHVLDKICRFLGVDPSFEIKKPVRYNSAGITRNQLLLDVLTRSNPLKAFLKPAVDIIFPEERRIHLIEGWKSRLISRPLIEAESRLALYKSYYEDIMSLQEYLRYDLTSWLE